MLFCKDFGEHKHSSMLIILIDCWQVLPHVMLHIPVKDNHAIHSYLQEIMLYNVKEKISCLSFFPCPPHKRRKMRALLNPTVYKAARDIVIGSC